MPFPFKDRALWAKSGSTDIYGQAKPGEAISIPCSILSLNEVGKLTPTKQSASKSRAEDDTITAEIIVPLSLGIGIDDVLVVAPADVERGVHLRVVSALPKTNLRGIAQFTDLRLAKTGE